MGGDRGVLLKKRMEGDDIWAFLFCCYSLLLGRVVAKAYLFKEHKCDKEETGASEIAHCR